MLAKADIGTHHKLSRMTLRINKRLARLKTIKGKNLLASTHKLKGTKEIFEINNSNNNKQKQKKSRKA